MVGRSVRVWVPGGQSGGSVGEPADDGSGEPIACNEVLLVGRVSGAPQERELPSGDRLVSWRLVVDRPPGGRKLPPGARVTTVDTLDCVAWAAGLRRTARGFCDGDLVELRGALRRRFWRIGAGTASRYEVEAVGLRRLRRRGGRG